jgi:hypothetical protein
MIWELEFTCSAGDTIVEIVTETGGALFITTG